MRTYTLYEYINSSFSFYSRFVLSLSLSLSLFPSSFPFISFFSGSFIFHKSCFTFSSHSTQFKTDRFDKSFCFRYWKASSLNPDRFIFRNNFIWASSFVNIGRSYLISFRFIFYKPVHRRAARCLYATIYFHVTFSCCLITLRIGDTLISKIGHRRSGRYCFCRRD